MASAFTLMAPAVESATIVAIRGEESVSSLFAIDVELASTKPLAPESWLGQPVRVAVAASGRTDRYVAGICARFAETGRGGTYRATVVPSIWPLTKRATSRIFQEKSAVEILQTIFAGYGVAFSLSGSYAKRTYCAQYRETDMQFAQRLMEDEGICFFFRQTKEGDQLVIADPPIAGIDVGSLAFATTASGAPIVYEWERAQELRAAKVTLRDYDFEKPRLDLTGQATAAGASAARLTEIYDYPAGVRDVGALSARAKVRLDEEQGTAIVARGATSSAALVAGGKLVVTGVAREGALFLTNVVSSIEQRDPGRAATVAVRFAGIPAGAPFRPARRTPRPVIAGIQIATVVGAAGAPVIGPAPGNERRFTDKYGRLKVQFRWDREGRSDEKSSCWIRVAGLWAGPKLGAVGLPALGAEVAVAFEEGNPDRPVIVGSLYNAEKMPPESLP